MRLSSEVRRAVIALCIMVLASAAGWMLKPGKKLSDVIGAPDLEHSIPLVFGDWHEQKAGVVQVVSAEQSAILDRIYRERLSRVYINSRAQQIMLSVAYSDEQQDGLSLHYPEVCYPAQGFKLLSRRDDALTLRGGALPIRRLQTAFDRRRYEPVSYWIMAGEKAVIGRLPRKFAEMQYAFRDQRNDAILFRVSSIDTDVSAAFNSQDQFIRDLADALNAKARKRLMGLQ